MSTPGAPELTHPEADLLTAFSEQTLSAGEREGVLEHLAICGDCREVISLALPAEEAVVAASVVRATPAPGKTARNWLTAFAWPTLRWAAVAAGVAIGASILLMRPGRLDQAMLPSVNSPGVPPPTAQKTVSAPITQSFAPGDAALAKTKSELSTKTQAQQLVMPTPQAKSRTTMLAANKSDSVSTNELASAPATGALRSNAASRKQAAAETTEVAAASPTLQAEASSEDRQMVENSTLAIMKAKPAPQSGSNQQNAISASAGGAPLQGNNNVASMAKFASTPGPTAARAVIWSVASGVLQRSLDGGRNWENILRPNRRLLCYASRDHDLWTGGRAGALFHSSDSGATWVRVQPNITSLPLSSDIKRIDLSSKSAIALFTANNETWSSGDGGNTWEKR